MPDFHITGQTVAFDSEELAMKATRSPMMRRTFSIQRNAWRSQWPNPFPRMSRTSPTDASAAAANIPSNSSLGGTKVCHDLDHVQPGEAVGVCALQRAGGGGGFPRQTGGFRGAA